MGVNDYLTRPVDKNELVARVRTQLRKKRYADRLRHNVQLSLEIAITDQLTGLHNRRYMSRHLDNLISGPPRTTSPWKGRPPFSPGVCKTAAPCRGIGTLCPPARRHLPSR